MEVHVDVHAPIIVIPLHDIDSAANDLNCEPSLAIFDLGRFLLQSTGRITDAVLPATPAIPAAVATPATSAHLRSKSRQRLATPQASPYSYPFSNSLGRNSSWGSADSDVTQKKKNDDDDDDDDYDEEEEYFDATSGGAEQTLVGQKGIIFQHQYDLHRQICMTLGRLIWSAHNF